MLAYNYCGRRPIPVAYDVVAIMARRCGFGPASTIRAEALLGIPLPRFTLNLVYGLS